MTLLWIMVILTGIFIDLTTSGFLFTVFSLGAVIALILNTFSASYSIQILVFLISSITLIVCLVPKIKAKISRECTSFVPSEERLLGYEFTLKEDLKESSIVNIEGVYWTIQSDDNNNLKANDKVRIVARNGNKYIVSKI